MNKKQLMELGVLEDQADQIIIMHGRDIESTKAEKARVEAEAEALKAQLEAAGNTIESFKAMNIEGVKAEAERYKTEAENAKANAEVEMYQLTFEHSLDKALAAAQARNPVTVMALLDYDKLDLNIDETGGTLVTGLEEQLAAIQTANPFLFASAEDEPRIVVGAQNHSVIGDAVVEAARKAAGLAPKE